MGSANFFRFFKRMTVIRLADQSLVLHPPIEINAHLIQELQAIGEIKYFIAPN